MTTTTHRRRSRRVAATAPPVYDDEQPPADDTTEPVEAAPEPETPAEPNVVGAAATMYRRHLNPWLWLIALAAAGAVVAHHHIPFVVVLPAAAGGVAGMYWRVKSAGHAAAERHGRLDPGELAGRHATTINARAARAARHAAAAGVWLLLVNLAAPFTLPGWAVWCLIGLPLWVYVSVPAWAAAERRRVRLAPDPHHYDHIDVEQDVDPDVEADPADDGRTVKDTIRLPRTPRTPPAPEGFQVPPTRPARPKPRRDVDLRGPANAIRGVLNKRNIDAVLIDDGQRGPTVTRYSIKLGPTGQVGDVTKAEKDLQYALATKLLQIHAPVEGRNAIGIDVPNDERDNVAFEDVFGLIPADAPPLTACLGADSFTGDPIIVDLAQGPHWAVGGQTGSGKSVGLNTIINTILRRNTPDQVRLMLIDPKRVELVQYDGIPHLITPVVTDTRRAVDALNWVVEEMDQRYREFAAAGVRGIGEYNRKATASTGSRHTTPYPYLLTVIDELADLMVLAKDEVEDVIQRITQLARGAGIHLLIATQSPRADVITGKIKANLPARLGFRTQSLSDSRVMLDEPGADKLLGAGDALLRISSLPGLTRLQVAYTGDDLIDATVAHWRKQANLKPGRRTVLAPPTTDADDHDNAQAAANANDRVLAAARRVANADGGLFEKSDLVAATSGMTVASRDKALYTLSRDGGPLQKVEGRKSWYQLATPTR